MFEKRYPGVDGVKLLKAYSLASKVPQEIASFYKGTWDFTLYSEGFLAPWQIGHEDGNSPFISIEELIDHETLDENYLNVSEFVKKQQLGSEIATTLITPLELSDRVMKNCYPQLNLLMN